MSYAREVGGSPGFSVFWDFALFVGCVAASSSLGSALGSDCNTSWVKLFEELSALVVRLRLVVPADVDIRATDNFIRPISAGKVNNEREWSRTSTDD